MIAFLTGSHAYGTPREDSDIDLVIRCDEETAKFLSANRDPMPDGSPAVKFGKLNFIPCTTNSTTLGEQEPQLWNTASL